MAASDFFQELKASAQEVDFSNLDYENPGVWPLVVKVAAWAAMMALVIGLGVYFLLLDEQARLESERNKERQLRTSFQEKAAKAANLEAYRRQMGEMEVLFNALVSQLPSDTEVPGLLEDMSQFAEKSGLKINTIGLQPEQRREIFVELPIQLELAGAYHDLGSFAGAIAALPRIVTLHDFKIERQDAKSSQSQLKVGILAKTYRFRQQEE